MPQSQTIRYTAVKTVNKLCLPLIGMRMYYHMGVVFPSKTHVKILFPVDWKVMGSLGLEEALMPLSGDQVNSSETEFLISWVWVRLLKARLPHPLTFCFFCECLNVTVLPRNMSSSPDLFTCSWFSSLHIMSQNKSHSMNY